jgi:putative hemolysin
MKLLPQNWQLWGFTPVCVLTWRFSVSFAANLAKHCNRTGNHNAQETTISQLRVSTCQLITGQQVEERKKDFNVWREIWAEKMAFRAKQPNIRKYWRTYRQAWTFQCSCPYTSDSGSVEYLIKYQENIWMSVCELHFHNSAHKSKGAILSSPLIC